MKLVYSAHSKRLFYFRQHISKFILEHNYVPLNPFMIFEYFMLDTIDRNKIRNANNNLVSCADELWVFGQVSDGVMVEIEIAKKARKPVKYFKIIKSREIKRIKKNQVEFEDGFNGISDDL